MEGQRTLYFVHINYEYNNVLYKYLLGTQLSWKAEGLDQQEVTVMVTTKKDIGLDFCLILGIST